MTQIPTRIATTTLLCLAFLSISYANPSYVGFGAGYVPNQTFGAPATPGTNATVSHAGYVGPWLEVGTIAYPKSLLNPSSLSYDTPEVSLITSGGSLRLDTNARLGREVITNSAPGTIYFSFLFQLENPTGTTTPPSGPPYVGIEFWNNIPGQIPWREFLGFNTDGSSNNGSDRKFALRSDHNSLFLTGIDISTPIQSLGSLDNNVNLFVFKIERTGIPNQDTLSIWRNPVLDPFGAEPSPSQAQAYVQITNHTFEFNAISFANFFENRSLLIDEIRFGNNYSDVIHTLPIPEPSTYALLLMAALALLILRRTQKKA